MIEETLVTYLKKENFEYKMSNEKYKIKFTLRATDDFENNVQDNVDICVRILQVENQNKVCVEFTKISGRQTTFLKQFEHYKNGQNILKCFNDCNYEETIQQS